MARTMYDWSGAPAAYRETVEKAVERTGSLAVKFQGEDPMVTVYPAPHSPHGASPERDYGLRPIHYLDSLGVLDDSEVGWIGSRGGSLAYCPSSNMFLAEVSPESLTSPA
ncbi:hypothetical protein ACFOLF_00180 [Paenibacillus sepulcri]|uniref:amidohydrolase family protein n=1 Tax=Paenibacillus sepulcri TaxID=359917 RepID=UPI0035ECFFA6